MAKEKKDKNLQKKAIRKEPTKTLKEKRAEKKAKRKSKNGGGDY